MRPGRSPASLLTRLAPLALFAALTAALLPAPAATAAGKPIPRISGIVKVPVVAALATALPEREPIRPLASTATFAGPPARRPKSRSARAITQPVAPAICSATPNSTNRNT